jgi:hypothetical protein
MSGVVHEAEVVVRAVRENRIQSEARPVLGYVSKSMRPLTTGSGSRNSSSSDTGSRIGL